MFRQFPLAAGLVLVAGCAAGPGVTTQAPAVSTAGQANPEIWPAARSPDAITDPQSEARIDALMANMTLEQKVGQLVQADISTITPQDLIDYPLGSLLAGGNSGPYGEERSSAADWHRLVTEFREASQKTPSDGVAIPIIFGVDAVHGHNNLPNATIFPHNIGLGAARDPDLIRRIGAVTAAEIAGSGIEWTFSPTLAVPQDLRWGRAYEGYSSDPQIVADYSSAMVLGLQGDLRAGEPLASDRVAATAKHFLADGGTAEGKDQGDARISEAELVRIHAAGYPPAIDAGALTVMASFSSWNGVKNHGNASLLTDVLKDRMGFEGFVVGDWNGHGQVPGCTVTSCAPSLMAGLDMFMAPDSWKELYKSLLQQARAGDIPQARIDDAVRRILRVKIKLGLLHEPAARMDLQAIGAPEHLAVAREAVAKSLVLLKNNGSILPIKPGAKVLVAGPGADSMAMQSGGWTISWQGRDVTNADFTNGQTIWEALAQAVEEAGGSAEFAADGAFGAEPDVAVVVFGEMPYAEMQGDLPTLDYQPTAPTDLALLQKLRDQGIPTVSVFLSGRPMFTNPEINASDAFVAAWLPGTQANGIADVLVAQSDGEPRRDFTGRLSFPWPADASGSLEEPLFSLGYGLTYGSDSTLALLSEDAGVDVVSALNLTDLFSGGGAPSPWTLSIGDAGGERPVLAAQTASPAGFLVARSVDVRSQEDAKTLEWNGPGTLTIGRPMASFADSESGVLRLQIRVDAAPEAPVALSFGGSSVDVGPSLREMGSGFEWFEIPLRCFAGLAEVDGVRISTQRAMKLTLLEAVIEQSGPTGPCPPPAG